jgi:GNAT superfamily N-acetyltransferase
MNCIARHHAHQGIKTEYMAKSLCSSALLLVMRDAETNSMEGVATANVLRDKPLSLVTICSVAKGVGVGSRMLDILANIARVLGLPGIQVKPIKSATTFYLRNGFEPRGNVMVLATEK